MQLPAGVRRWLRPAAPPWPKFTCATGQEMVIGGFTDPAGSRTGLGALLIGGPAHG